MRAPRFAAALCAPVAVPFTVVAATLLPLVGRATGGRHAFTGGTPRESGSER
jgi:hypothetical protein